MIENYYDKLALKYVDNTKNGWNQTYIPNFKNITNKTVRTKHI